MYLAGAQAVGNEGMNLGIPFRETTSWTVYMDYVISHSLHLLHQQVLHGFDSRGKSLEQVRWSQRVRTQLGFRDRAARFLGHQV